MTQEASAAMMMMTTKRTDERRKAKLSNVFYFLPLVCPLRGWRRICDSPNDVSTMNRIRPHLLLTAHKLTLFNPRVVE